MCIRRECPRCHRLWVQFCIAGRYMWCKNVSKDRHIFCINCRQRREREIKEEKFEEEEEKRRKRKEDEEKQKEFEEEERRRRRKRKE